MSENHEERFPINASLNSHQPSLITRATASRILWHSELPGENQNANNDECDCGHALDPDEREVIAEHASGHHANR